jgi:hypothetical protein
MWQAAETQDKELPPYIKIKSNFTFSEPRIVMHILEKDQQDAPFFLDNLFQLIYPRHVSNK